MNHHSGQKKKDISCWWTFASGWWSDEKRELRRNKVHHIFTVTAVVTVGGLVSAAGSVRRTSRTIPRFTTKNHYTGIISLQMQWHEFIWRSVVNDRASGNSRRRAGDSRGCLPGGNEPPGHRELLGWNKLCTCVAYECARMLAAFHAVTA